MICSQAATSCFKEIWLVLQDNTWFSHLVYNFYSTCKHTHKSFLVSQRGTVAVRKDLQGPPVLPAVGWLEGLAVFVKVMGPRWANSQGTRSMLCHLRSTLVEKELAKGGWGRGLRFPALKLSPKSPQPNSVSSSSTWKWLPGQPWANKPHMECL